MKVSKKRLARKERVTGIGGIFFKARDAKKLMAWYQKRLGVRPEQKGSTNAMFQWREDDYPDRVGQTVWAFFPHDTEYFDPSSSQFMINFRVSNLKGLFGSAEKGRSSR